MYIFGGQVDNFYLGDIVAMDMKTSKLAPSFYPFFTFCCRPWLFHSTTPNQTQVAMILFCVSAPPFPM